MTALTALQRLVRNSEQLPFRHGAGKFHAKEELHKLLTGPENTIATKYIIYLRIYKNLVAAVPYIIAACRSGSFYCICLSQLFLILYLLVSAVPYIVSACLRPVPPV